MFSNALLTDDGRVYLLDMRGELGSHLTLQGDLTYDLSKVYQVRDHSSSFSSLTPSLTHTLTHPLTSPPTPPLLSHLRITHEKQSNTLLFHLVLPSPPLPQSLLGYDYIILSQPLHERDAELLEELRHTFRAFVREHYPTVRLSDIVKITASHYFGIVPLHVNREHQAAYLQTASALISSLAANEYLQDQ